MLAAVHGHDDEASQDEVVRPRLDVLGINAADVVESVGGWLYDRAFRGWDVTVFLAEFADARPLRILGAKALPLDSTFSVPPDTRHNYLLAVAGELIGSHDPALALLTRALDEHSEHALVWGAIGLHRRAQTVEHQLTSAACAFKTHALRAAEVADAPVRPTERFRCPVKRFRPSDWDLSVVG